MSLAISRAKYTGDPGLFDFLKKAATIGTSFIPFVGPTISQAIATIGSSGPGIGAVGVDPRTNPATNRNCAGGPPAVRAQCRANAAAGGGERVQSAVCGSSRDRVSDPRGAGQSRRGCGPTDDGDERNERKGWRLSPEQVRLLPSVGRVRPPGHEVGEGPEAESGERASNLAGNLKDHGSQTVR